MSQIDDEKQFIHDLASPLSTAIFTLDVLLETLAKSENPQTRLEADLSAVRKSLMRMSLLVQSRRETLLSLPKKN